MQGDPQRDLRGRVKGQLYYITDALFCDQLIHDAHAEPLLHHGHDRKAFQRGKLHIRHNTVFGKKRCDIVIATQCRHNESVVGTLLQRVRLRSCQRMILRQQCQHGVLGQWDPLVGHPLLIAEKANICRAVVQPLGHLLPDTLHQADPDLGIVLLERTDHRRKPVGGDAGIGSNGHTADQQSIHLRRQFKDTILMPQKFPHCRKQHLSILRQRDAFCIAAKHRKSQLFFQRGYQLVHAGGSIAERLCRLGKASCLRCR